MSLISRFTLKAANDAELTNQELFHPEQFVHILLKKFGILILTQLIGVPIIRILDLLGYSSNLLKALSKKARKSEIMSRNFGQYRPTEHDVLVCSYPKSGTNWTLQIVHQITTKGHGNYQHIHEVVPWPDELISGYSIDLFNEQLYQHSPTGLRVIKTHLEQNVVPYSRQAKYIYIIRDPKEVFVSMYHFIYDFLLGPLMPSVDAWLEFFLSDSFLLTSWASHLNDYWKARHLGNFLILTYKEMIDDLPKVVYRIAKFIDVELTFNEFSLICSKSTFEFMKNIDFKFNPGILTPWGSTHAKMIRKGKYGNSSELLTAEQQRCIDIHFKNELQRAGCDFPYDELCDIKI